MDARGSDLIEREIWGSPEPRAGWRSKLERVTGAFFIAGAGLGLLGWVLFLAHMVLGGAATSVTVGGSPVGTLGVLLVSPAVLALIATQGLLGIGLFKQRPWVGWFALLYVLGTVLAVGAAKVLPTAGLFALMAPVLGTLPTWVFVARWRRGEVQIGEDR